MMSATTAITSSRLGIICSSRGSKARVLTHHSSLLRSAVEDELVRVQQCTEEVFACLRLALRAGESLCDSLGLGGSWLAAQAPEVHLLRDRRRLFLRRKQFLDDLPLDDLAGRRLTVDEVECLRERRRGLDLTRAGGGAGRPAERREEVVRRAGVR